MRFVTVLVNVQLHDWRPVERTLTGIVLRYATHPDAVLRIGGPDDSVPSVVRMLHRRMSRAIYRRIRADGTFRTCLLLAALMDANPKSLIRMLSPNGNPSARHLMSIVRLVADAESVRLRVGAERVR